jgi:transcriptional regulator with XRE-family HTH domain
MSVLKDKRERLGLTLQEVAETIGAHATTVSSWETGKKIPKPKNRLKLANLYNCTVDELNEPATNDVLFEEPSSEGSDAFPDSPFAKYYGELVLGQHTVDCYVLDTGERVISFRGLLRAIADREGGNLAEYIGVSGLKAYINKDDFLATTIEFNIPGAAYLSSGKGIPAESFLTLCNAYVSAYYDGNLTTERQQQIAIRCSMLLAACAKVGLIALIDEATGYQYDRKENSLQLKLKAFIADEMRGWEKTFPDELWEQFGRLTHWQGNLHLRPKWWGKLVMELIYNAIDSDVALYLKEHKPPPVHKKNYHQWLSDHYGLKQLITHIYQIIGMAKTCSTMKELQEKVALYYDGKPLTPKV